MTASSRGSRVVGSIIRSSRRRPFPICSECTSYLSRRTYSAAAASLKPVAATPEPPNLRAIPPVSTSPYGDYLIRAGVLLTRPPILTPTLTSFEKAFFFYQKRLQERLALPFTRYFYFKKDTPADTDYKLKARERNFAPARELGGYKAFGDESWNDELLIKEAEESGITEPGYIKAALVREARTTVNEDGVAISQEQQEEQVANDRKAVKWRITEADDKRDYKRLDRRLDKTLYLLVKREGGAKGGKNGGGWGFPSDVIVGRENLHQAAERILVQTGGENMNTWVIGHVPVGHHVRKPYYTPDTKTLERKGEKTFFMKSRIMAGQANITGNLFGLTDFKWLTKEEVEKHVSDKYFSQVKNMMADR